MAAQIAMALMAPAALAAAADFSHREHLSYGLACTGCHVSVKTSTRVEDNNLPRREACLGCHTDAAIKSPRPMPLAHFSHQQHTGMLDCLQCHRGIETSEVTAQVAGSANFPRMAYCVTCHEQNDMPNGCWKCHSQAMQLKPAFHVEGFVDSHSHVKHSAAEKASCDVCHGSNFRCAGCH